MFPRGAVNVTYPGDAEWPYAWSPIPVHTIHKPTDHVSLPLRVNSDNFNLHYNTNKFLKRNRINVNCSCST